VIVRLLTWGSTCRGWHRWWSRWKNRGRWWRGSPTAQSPLSASSGSIALQSPLLGCLLPGRGTAVTRNDKPSEIKQW